MVRKRNWKLLSILAVIAAVCWLGSISPAAAQPQIMPQDVLTPLNQGYDLMAAGKYDLAKKEFEKVIKTDPANPFANNNLAAIAEREGQLQVALGYLKKGMEKVDQYPYRAATQVCFPGGLCTAVKPEKNAAAKTGTSIAAIMGDNLKKLTQKELSQKKK